MAEDTPAYFGQGITLGIGDGSDPQNYTDIAGCNSFTGPGFTRDTVDVTSHSSPDGYRQYISGLRDGGEVTFDVFWQFGDEGQDALIASFDEDDAFSFQMGFPMAPQDNLITFDAFVTNNPFTGPIDNAVTRSITLKITGKPVIGDIA